MTSAPNLKRGRSGQRPFLVWRVGVPKRPGVTMLFGTSREGGQGGITIKAVGWDLSDEYFTPIESESAPEQGDADDEQ